MEGSIVSKQEISKKRRILCSEIIGKPVRAAFMNGNLPHGVALAWTGQRDAYLVNLKTKTKKEYVREGKFLLKRALFPLKIFIPENE
jgi:hypothetical protein